MIQFFEFGKHSILHKIHRNITEIISYSILASKVCVNGMLQSKQLRTNRGEWMGFREEFLDFLTVSGYNRGVCVQMM